MSQNSPSSKSFTSSFSSDFLPLVTSIGLFLATTAISQWVGQGQQQYQPPAARRRRARGRQNNEYWDDDECDDDENDDAPPDDFQDWYKNRRSRGRLSYENLQNHMIQAQHLDESHSSSLLNESNITTMPATRFERARTPQQKNYGIRAGYNNDKNRNNSDTSLCRSSEWDLHRRQTVAMKRKSSVTTVATTSRPSSNTLADKSTATATTTAMEVHPNAHYDFHPKNTNWKHFEHYNEKDRARHQQKMVALAVVESESAEADSQSQKTKIEFENTEMMIAHQSNQQQQQQQESSNSSSCGGDDAQSISSDGSESSEEQFVWMKHKHYHRTGTAQEDSENWSERLKRRVSSSLVQLFDATSDSSTAAEDDSRLEEEEIRQKEPSHKKMQEKSVNSGFLAELTSNDTTVRRRNGENNQNHQNRKYSSIARRTMSSPDLSHQQIRVRPPTNRKYTRTRTEPSSPADEYYDGELQGGRFDINNRMLHRAQYNAHIMPEKLVMIRHGQSMGNINELLYSTTPDNAMPLTDLGWKQARASGRILRNKILGTGQSVHFIVSPYVRTVETFHGIASAWCDPKEFDHIKDKEQRIKAWYGRLIEMGLTWNEDSRIREQDFGNYQDPDTIKRAKHERHRFGVFYYRFPYGESASDVFDRVSTFLDSLWRSFEMNRSRNYVLVTHGISIRVLLARYFRYTIDQFNMLANPRNCEMVVLGHNDGGKLELEGRCALEKKDDESNKNGEDGCDNVDLGFNYKFHKRLRILPRSEIRKVRIRISPDDK